MLPFHSAHRLSTTFNDANVWSSAGIAIATAMALGSGLGDLADASRTVPGYVGASSGLKFTALVAGMLAGTDSIDDMAPLHLGGMRELFWGTSAPPALGSFLRSFTFGLVLPLVRPRLRQWR